MDIESADFHLQSDSPAHNTGTPVFAPEVDYDRLTRPQGGAVDSGAFEIPEN